jgi:PAS domain S-box-containing protein
MKVERPDGPPLSQDDPWLGRVLDAALDGVVVLRSDGVVGDWNHQAEAIFGWTRDEAVGRMLAELVIPAPLREAHHRGLAHFLATGEGPLLRRRVEVNALRKSGEEFPIELSISPVTTAGATMFLGFVRDITDRRRAEESLRRSAREAELLNQVTGLAAESASFDEVLRFCLGAVCELAGWPAGHAYLPAKSGPPRLEPTMIWHGDPEAFTALKAATKVSVFTPGHGVPGRVWSTGKPYLAPDISADDADFPRAKMADDIGVGAAFGFPITSGGEVVAVLEFFCHEPVEPEPRMLLIVRAIGEQVGRVLERRRVHDHQALLLAELDHRAKNMLAVVMGMADQTARRATSVQSFQEGFSARLTSLARAYGLLTARSWRATALSDIVDQIVAPYMADAPLEMTGPPIELPPKAAMTMGMILHELAANATKYGALSRPGGRLAIGVSREDSQEGPMVEIHWRETGVPDIKPPVHRGFGAKLIEASIRREFGGQVHADFASDGVRYRFRFPEPVA